MVIALTGCAGFIGSNFAHWLLENTEHTVIGIDNLSGGYLDNVPELSNRFHFRNFDINATSILNCNFERYKPDICFHMAAYASEGRSNHIRTFIHQNNTIGTSNIINACVNYNCKLVFLSSVAVYSGKPPFTEDTIPNPIDEYGLSKLISEKSIQIAGEVHGLDWCIIRPRNVYGQRQSIWDMSRNLFGIHCYKAINKLPLTIFGDGSNKRSFTYVGDILEPLYNSINLHKQIINLGSRIPYTVKEATEIFIDVTGHFNVEYSEARHEVQEAYCNIMKSKQLLGFEDKTSLYEGLKKMWSWARKQPERNLQVPPKLEIHKNLHSSIK